MAGFKDLFIPRDTAFLDYLKEQVSLLSEISKYLSFFQKKFDEETINNLYPKLNKVLKKASDKTSHITQELNETFITPIDRDEIQDLSFNIDRLICSVNTIITTIDVYNIKKLDSSSKSQIKIFQKLVNLLSEMFENLLNTGNQKLIKAIKEYENKADCIYRKALKKLFSEKRVRLDIIKNHELLKVIERSIDKIEFVVNIVQNILINHA